MEIKAFNNNICCQYSECVTHLTPTSLCILFYWKLTVTTAFSKLVQQRFDWNYSNYYLKVGKLKSYTFQVNVAASLLCLHS